MMLNTEEREHLQRIITDFCERSREVIYTMIDLTGDRFVPAKILNLLEERHEDSERLALILQERLFAEYAVYDAGLERTRITEVPIGVNYRLAADSILEFRFPLWLFTSKIANHLKPPYHKRQPFIRIRQFWRALVHHLVPVDHGCYGPRSTAGPFSTKVKGVLTMTFFTYLSAMDPDNYDVSPFINALVTRGIMMTDHPSKFELHICYESVASKEEERVIATLHLGH